MLHALRALFEHPQNNLRLFWGGRPVGLREGLQAWAAAGGSSCTAGGSCGQEAGAGNGDAGGKEGALTGEASEASAVGTALCPGGGGGEDGPLEHLLPLLVEILMLEGKAWLLSYCTCCDVVQVH
jgi:hypothetical protein